MDGVGAERVYLGVSQNFQPLRRRGERYGDDVRWRFWLRRDKQVDFDFDFNILTAFIRLGRAGPVGAGCPPYL